MASQNKYLENHGDYIRANYKFNPRDYQGFGTYVLLYQEIANSLPDYGFPEHVTLDRFIDEKIKKIVKFAKKINENRSMALPDSDGLDEKDPDYKNALDWIKRLLPCKEVVEKDFEGNPVLIDGRPLYSQEICVEGADELGYFLTNFDKIREEVYRVKSLNGSNDPLSIDDAQLIMDAKYSKVRELYEFVRKNQVYKPGKIDKDGSSKNGLHAAAYFEAENELKKKQRLLRRNGFYNVLKGAASLGCAAMMVVSGGALLSYGGFALTSIFGTVFSAAGVGASALGAVGAVAGFFGTKNFFKRFRQGLKKSYDMRIEIKDFVGPKFMGRDIERFLGANWGKDGKGVTLNEKKTLYNYDRALELYFKLPGGKNDPKFPPELKIYLPDSLIKKHKLTEDKKWFDYVSKKGGYYELMKERLLNTVSKVQGDGKHYHTELLGEANKMLSDDPENQPTVQQLLSLSEKLSAYKDTITAEKEAAFQRKISNKVVSIVIDQVFENAYNSSNLADTQAYLSDPRVSKMIENSDRPNVKAKVSDIVNFLASEEQSTDRPLDSTVGVNIGAQYATSSSDMKNACLSLNKTLSADVLSIVETITTAISNPVNQTKQHFYVAGSGGKSIDTLVSEVEASDPKVGAYLRFMFNKKLDSLGNHKDSIKTTIQNADTSSTPTELDEICREISELRINADESISSPRKTLVQIREMITKLSTTGFIGLTSDQQSMAFQMLDDQIQALERNQRERARVGSFNIVKNGTYSIPKGGKFIQLEEIISSIDSLTYDSIKSAETKKLFVETICKITPPEMCNYIRLKFSQKIETLFTNYIEEHSSELEMGTDAITKIATFMADVQNNKFITGAQKDRIVKAIEPKIKLAFATKLKNMEKYLMEDVSKNEYSQTLSSFYNKTYQEAGFIDYFAKKTVDSQKIFERIKRLERGLTLKTLLSAGGIEEVPTIIDENSADTKTFLKIYFAEGKDRQSSDKLTTKLGELQTITQNADLTSFAKNDYLVAGSNDFINEMSSFINTNLLPSSSSGLDNPDKLAALLVAKKRALAMFKLHMYRFIQGEANPAAYVTGAGSVSLANIKLKWQSLLDLIDGTYTALKVAPENASLTEPYTSAVASMNAGTSSANFRNFIISKQLQPSL